MNESQIKVMGFTEQEIELAHWMHDTYEKLASEMEWETQKSCKGKPWQELPIKNRATMLRLARRLIEKYGIGR